jgi:hypothetical protein
MELKDFLRPIHIIPLMLKQVSTLALQMVERQKLLTVALTRIDYGFLKDENMVEASRHLHDITKLIQQIEASLKPAPIYMQASMKK